MPSPPGGLLQLTWKLLDWASWSLKRSEWTPFCQTAPLEDQVVVARAPVDVLKRLQRARDTVAFHHFAAGLAHRITLVVGQREHARQLGGEVIAVVGDKEIAVFPVSDQVRQRHGVGQQ